MADLDILQDTNALHEEWRGIIMLLSAVNNHGCPSLLNAVKDNQSHQDIFEFRDHCSLSFWSLSTGSPHPACVASGEGTYNRGRGR